MNAVSLRKYISSMINKCNKNLKKSKLKLFETKLIQMTFIFDKVFSYLIIYLQTFLNVCFSNNNNQINFLQ